MRNNKRINEEILGKNWDKIGLQHQANKTKRKAIRQERNEESPLKAPVQQHLWPLLHGSFTCFCKLPDMTFYKF